MKIYRVRVSDNRGIEVATFGYYADKLDAEKRRAEIARGKYAPGRVDVVEITVVPSSTYKPHVHTEEPAWSYDMPIYKLKDKK